MNRQAIYDRIAKHLLKQGRKSVGPDADHEGMETCVYRAYDPNAKRTLKCAIGCLIPFGSYTPELEGTNVFAVAVRDAFPRSLHINTEPMSEDLVFLSHLQDIHDNQPVESWIEFLQDFAYQNGLDTAVLDA